MRTLVVTGGIATGKSSFCRVWHELEPATVSHDADAVVHRLFGEPEVRALLSRAFGPEVLLGDTEVDRSMLRRAIAHDPAKKSELEGILHPRVRADRDKAMARAALGGHPWFLAEIPVFYESGAVKPVPDARVVVVACGPGVQRERLQARNPFDNDEAGRMINVQAALAAKMAAADHVIWNEGQPSVLRQQAVMLRDALAALEN